AFGSNIANIGLILGLTALIRPSTVHSTVIRREMPILLAVTAFAFLQLSDGLLSRLDALAMFAVLGALVGWSIRESRRHAGDVLAGQYAQAQPLRGLTSRQAILRTAAGLAVLVASS